MTEMKTHLPISSSLSIKSSRSAIDLISNAESDADKSDQTDLSVLIVLPTESEENMLETEQEGCFIATQQNETKKYSSNVHANIREEFYLSMIEQQDDYTDLFDEIYADQMSTQEDNIYFQDSEEFR